MYKLENAVVNYLYNGRYNTVNFCITKTKLLFDMCVYFGYFMYFRFYLFMDL